MQATLSVSSSSALVRVKHETFVLEVSWTTPACQSQFANLLTQVLFVAGGCQRHGAADGWCGQLAKMPRLGQGICPCAGAVERFVSKKTQQHKIKHIIIFKQCNDGMFGFEVSFIYTQAHEGHTGSAKKHVMFFEDAATTRGGASSKTWPRPLGKGAAATRNSSFCHHEHQ